MLRVSDIGCAHFVLVLLQQSSPNSSNGTLPGVLPDQRLVVTSTGLQTDGGDSSNITGASAFDRISSIEDDALGANIMSPYKRLIRCFCYILLYWMAVLGLGFGFACFACFANLAADTCRPCCHQAPALVFPCCDFFYGRRSFAQP